MNVEVKFFINGAVTSIEIPADQTDRMENYLQHALLGKLNDEVLSFGSTDALNKVAFKIKQLDGYSLSISDPNRQLAAKLQAQVFQKIDKHLDAESDGDDWKNSDDL